MKEFEQPLIFKLVPWFIGFCFIAVIGGWIAEHPHEAASGAGALVGDFIKSTGLVKP